MRRTVDYAPMDREEENRMQGSVHHQTEAFLNRAVVSAYEAMMEVGLLCPESPIMGEMNLAIEGYHQVLKSCEAGRKATLARELLFGLLNVEEMRKAANARAIAFRNLQFENHESNPHCIAKVFPSPHDLHPLHVVRPPISPSSPLLFLFFFFFWSKIGTRSARFTLKNLSPPRSSHSAVPPTSEFPPGFSQACL